MTDTTESHDSTADDGQTRRRFLTAATSAVGVGGVAGVAVPFLGSWNPSEKAKAAGAPVRADIGKLDPGQMVVIEWRGKPVYVLRRTPEQIAGLVTLNEDLKDPQSAASAQPNYIAGEGRAINDEFLVIVGLCTHLGCARRSFDRRWAQPIWVAMNGWAGSSARATAPNSILLGAYIKAFRHPIISKFPLIHTRVTTCW
jgi:ubiquinol-cytochrome c reductase iron-sulfur subunit